MSRVDYYRPSGRAPLWGALLALIVAAISATALGAVYGYATAKIPFVYLNFVLTLGFGISLGFLVGLGTHLGKVRSTALSLFIAVCAALYSQYAQWAVWFYVSGRSATLAIEPFQLWQRLVEVNGQGAWHLGSWRPLDLWLWIVWGLESATVVICAVLLPTLTTATTPFCERCRRWIDADEVWGPFAPPDTHQQLVELLERGDLDALLRLLHPHTHAQHYAFLQIEQCTKCNRVAYLSVTERTFEPDDDGRPEKADKAVIEHLGINGDTAQKIRATAKQAGISPHNAIAEGVPLTPMRPVAQDPHMPTTESGDS